MVLAIGHTLRAHEALGRPDALPGFFEAVHRLFEDGNFVGYDNSIRIGGILRSPDYFTFSREFFYQRREGAGCGPGYVLRALWSHYELIVLRHYARRIDASLSSEAMSMRAKVSKDLGPLHYS